MNNYEKLLSSITSSEIKVIETDLGTNKACGKCVGNIIFINSRMSSKEKYCILIEELSHCKLTVGNISNLENTSNRKQEIKARRLGYEKIVGVLNLISAFENGARTKYEISEYLEITEKFLTDAIDYYKQKYGMYFEVDNYVLHFEPTLGITKRF